MTEPLPIKVRDPIDTSPLMITPVEIWQWSPNLTPCSISAWELMMVLFPTLAVELIVAP